MCGSSFVAGRRTLGPVVLAVGALLFALLLAGTPPVPVGASDGFVIPDEIIGMDFNDARDLLEDEGIDVEKDDVDTKEFPQSTVAFADPGPGTVVQPDDEVVLFRSSGRDPRGEFSFRSSASIPSTVAGHLVRGGLDGVIEPRYAVQTSFGCNELANHMTVRSDGDFASLVHVDVPQLPDGVTEGTATTVVVTKDRPFTGQTLRLEAGQDAATGNATATARATGGSVVRTLELPLTVGDEPVSCDD